MFKDMNVISSDLQAQSYLFKIFYLKLLAYV